MILQAHNNGPLTAHEQEQAALAAILPALRVVRDEMLQQEELELEAGTYKITDLVPKPDPKDPDSDILRYRDLVVEVSEFGHTLWTLGTLTVEGPRHLTYQGLQRDMKLVEAWFRGRKPSQEEFETKIRNMYDEE